MDRLPRRALVFVALDSDSEDDVESVAVPLSEIGPEEVYSELVVEVPLSAAAGARSYGEAVGGSSQQHLLTHTAYSSTW